MPNQDDTPELAESFLVNITSVELVGGSVGAGQPSLKRPGNEVAEVTIQESDDPRGILQFNVSKVSTLLRHTSCGIAQHSTAALVSLHELEFLRMSPCWRTRYLHQATSSICQWRDLLVKLEDWSSTGRRIQSQQAWTISARCLATSPFRMGRFMDSLP